MTLFLSPYVIRIQKETVWTNMINQERYNLSSFDFDAALFEGWVPWGYTPEAPVGEYKQPFATEDIVVVSGIG